MKYRIAGRFCIERDAYIETLCMGKRVLHIGACDAPYTAEKKAAGLLLHEKLDRVTSKLLGIDIDHGAIELMESYGFTNIIRYDMNKLGELDFSPEVIVFGETIEHLVDFGHVFENFRSIMSTNTVLCISTPNAFSISNFKNALKGYESTHHDHTVCFTPRTLEHMVEVNGFRVNNKVFTFLGRKKVRLSRRLKKRIAAVFPMLSDTLLFECSLPPASE